MVEEGSNLATTKNLFQFKLTKNLSMEVRAEEKGNTLTHCVIRAVAVGEEEETRRKRERCGGII